MKLLFGIVSVVLALVVICNKVNGYRKEQRPQSKELKLLKRILGLVNHSSGKRTYCAKSEVEDPCQNVCQNNGTCLLNTSDNTLVCQCIDGYFGDKCEEYDADVCDSNPCENGGGCLPSGFGFECLCPFLFTGTNCETARTCSPDPCLNGGICQATSDGLFVGCNCRSDFCGDICDCTRQATGCFCV